MLDQGLVPPLRRLGVAPSRKAAHPADDSRPPPARGHGGASERQMTLPTSSTTEQDAAPVERHPTGRP
jgi:hypothetical protein